MTFFLTCNSSYNVELLTFHNVVSSFYRPSNFHPSHSDTSALPRTFPHPFYQGFGTLHKTKRVLNYHCLQDIFYVRQLTNCLEAIQLPAN